MHERGALGFDEGFEFLVESGEFGMVCNAVEGVVVSMITLVFPDMDFRESVQIP